MTEPIDEFLPLFHFRERHARRIEAPPRQVAAQLREMLRLLARRCSDSASPR